VSGPKPELLVTQQPALGYVPEDPGEEDLLEELANSVQKSDVYRKKASIWIPRERISVLVGITACGGLH
jgi:hypothetical protein